MKMGKHHNGLLETMKAKPGRKTPKSRLFFYLAIATVCAFLLLQWTSFMSRLQGGATTKRNGPLQQACLGTIIHFHEVLTDWMGGNPPMSEKELWEELKLSDDVRVQLMQGAVYDKEGLLLVLEGRKGSSIGFETKPVNISLTDEGSGHVRIEFTELQFMQDTVVTVVSSEAKCRERKSLSPENELDAEIYSLKEHLVKTGTDAAAYATQFKSWQTSI